MNVKLQAMKIKEKVQAMLEKIEAYRRIRATSRRVQLAGKPSTNSVLEASGGRGTSDLPPPYPKVLSFTVVPGSMLPIPTIRGSSTARLDIPPPMDLADCPPP